jgi:hypothetical protein
MGNGSRRASAAAAAVLGLVLATGCASVRAPGEQHASWMATQAGQFTFEYTDRDLGDVRQVQQALVNAAPRLLLWGRLREQVKLRLLPNHEQLQRALDALGANQRGVTWLRGWSRYDEVLLQAPRTWSLLGTPQRQVDELLTHELTHSLMYQLAADRLGWSRKQIPLWFREGMASYTANQAYRWVTLEDMARHLQKNPDSDPVGQPAELYRNDSNLVYGAAHHAFAFLVKRYGEEKVRTILSEMQGGKVFPEAFESAVGLPPDVFVRDFTRYVRWRGFRGGRSLAQDS